MKDDKIFILNTPSNISSPLIYCKKGANIRTVQELLGHSSLSTTEKYLAVTDQDKAWMVGLLDGSSRSNGTHR